MTPIINIGLMMEIMKNNIQDSPRKLGNKEKKMIFAVKELITSFGKRAIMGFQKEHNLIYNKETGELTPVIKRGKEVRLYKMGGGWGSAINVCRWPKKLGDKYEVSGHKNPKPVKGDLLLIPMESGKTLLTMFVDTQPCNDPPDMFFAEIKKVDYVDNMDEASRNILMNASEGPITL